MMDMIFFFWLAKAKEFPARLTGAGSSGTDMGILVEMDLGGGLVK